MIIICDNNGRKDVYYEIINDPYLPNINNDLVNKLLIN